MCVCVVFICVCVCVSVHGVCVQLSVPLIRKLFICSLCSLFIFEKESLPQAGLELSLSLFSVAVLTHHD